MSTVPATPLLDDPAEGPIFDAAALERDVPNLLEAIVRARREIQSIDAMRQECSRRLVEVFPAMSADARARLEKAQAELEAYLAARVENPIP